MWWALLLACQAPFDVDRRDLVGFRVVAIEVGPASAGETVTPRLSVVVDGRPWSAAPVEMRWFWLDDAAQLASDALPEPAGFGPRPTLTVPREHAILGLIATAGDAEARAFHPVRADAVPGVRPDAISSETAPWTLATATEASLLLDARRATPAGEPADYALPGASLQLRALGVPDTGLVRWSATAGTLLERDATAVDWFAGNLYLDNGEPVIRDVSPRGPVTVIALSLGHGAVSAVARDLYVGDVPPGTWIGARHLPGEPLSGAATVSLRSDDDSASGLRSIDAGPADGPVDELACEGDVQGPFTPDWLLWGWCSRDQLDGARVLVVPR